MLLGIDSDRVIESPGVSEESKNLFSLYFLLGLCFTMSFKPKKSPTEIEPPTPSPHFHILTIDEVTKYVYNEFMNVEKRGMPETDYRASRICRVLGNPTAYKILKLLGERKLTPSQLAELTGLSISTVSSTLRILRKIDLVRYLAVEREKIYWVKEKEILYLSLIHI